MGKLNCSVFKDEIANKYGWSDVVQGRLPETWLWFRFCAVPLYM